jgi:tetraacyldisaccharide 4'-kinase
MEMSPCSGETPGRAVIVGEERYQVASRRKQIRRTYICSMTPAPPLARNFDIVLITPDDIRDRLLPAEGCANRCPHFAATRSFTSGASQTPFPDPTLNSKLFWRVRRGMCPTNVPASPAVFCGIARPRNFVAQLRTAGIEPIAEAFYRDHHAYTEQDIRDLLNLRQHSQAGGFVTTEKDAVNLGGFLAALEPLAVVPVNMELADAANAVDTMLARIAERTPSA